MVQIAGINFYIEYHPGVSGGFSQVQVADLIGKLTTLFSSSQVSQFLAPLAGQDVYLTTSWPQAWTSQNGHNTEAIGVYNYYSQAWNAGGVLTGSFTSGQIDGNGAYVADQSLSSLNLESHNVIAFDAGQMADYAQPGGVRAIDATGTSFEQTLYRVIFHELAHLVSLPNSGAFEAFSDKASTTENIAIAAEDLIYAPVNAQPSRVGHNYNLVQGTKSNDPKLAFRHLTSNVVFSEGVSAAGQYNASFSGFTADGEISKTYYAAGTDAAGQKVAGQIFLDALADGDILKSDGSPSALLKDLLSGVAHDSSTEARLASTTRLLSQLANEKLGVFASLGTASPSDASVDFLSNLTDASLAGVRRASGISNEMSADHAMFSGPILDTADNKYVGSPVIAQKSIAGGLLIGASGAQQLNVNFTNRSDKLVGLDGVTNVLVAGSGGGKGSAANDLVGGSANDILIGGKGDDLLHAEQGSDIVIQSAGHDTVLGNGKTVFVASEANAKPIFDTNIAIGDEYIVSNGASGSGTTALRGVSTFVGNQTRTTFIGNGKTASTFVAGAGGGDFTLKNGDVAIGNPDVVNIYRLSTTLIDGVTPTVTILNLGPKDIIIVDGKRFNGNIHTYSAATGALGDYVVNEKGSSTWGTSYQKFSLKENYSKQGTVKPFDPVSDLPNAIAYLHSNGLDSENNILNIKQLHDHPESTYIVYSVEQYAASGGFLPGYPYAILYMHDADGNVLHDSDYGPGIPGPSYLSPRPSNIVAGEDRRRDVAYVKAGSEASDGTIVFSDVQNGLQIAGLNLSVTGFQNGASAGGVYFSTNDIEFDGQGKPHATDHFGPGSPAWQHVYPSNLAGDGVPPPLDIFTPASSIGQPFNPTIPTRVYGSSGGGVIGNIWQEQPEHDVPALVGDGGANDLAFGRTYGLITGNGGGDVFHYALGDGSVAVDEADTSLAVNSLSMGPGIDPGAVTVRGNEFGDLVLSLASGAEITLIKALQSKGAQHYGVQTVTFDNGTTWSYDDLVVRAADTPGPKHVLYGDAGMQIFEPAGSVSRVQGSGGGDVILFDRGHGPLSIFEAETDGTAINTLRFGSNVLPDDIVVDGDINGNLVLSIAGSSDRITVEGGLANAAADLVRYGIQAVEFSNGTIWSIDDIIGRLSSPGGQNTLYGDGNAQTFDTQGYARGIVGGGGGDVFVYGSGYGALAINELDVGATPHNVLQIGSGLSSDHLSVTADSRGNLVLDFGGGDRITLTGALLSTTGAARGVQHIVFTGESNLTLSYADLLARADTPTTTNLSLFGDAGANMFDSLGVAHSIAGGGGNDIIAYGRGYGALAIDERDTSVAADNELHFAAGIAAGDVSVSGTSDGDILLDLGNGDRITLISALKNGGDVRYGVQKLVFDGGTTWTYGDLLALLTTATSTRTALFGDGSANVLDPLGLATSVTGGGGGDTIKFGLGYGALTLDEREADSTRANVLAFGAGIDPAHLAVHGTSSGDLVLSVGPGDQVTLKNALGTLAGGLPGVQRVTFADGTVLTAADLLALASTASATNLDIYGSAKADLLDTLGIAHSATGGGGEDSFVFQRGYGTLTINERDITGTPDNALFFGGDIQQADLTVSANAAGDLILDLGDGDKVVVTQALRRGDDAVFGIQRVVFANGTALSYDNLVALAMIAAPGRSDLYGDYNPNTLDGQGIAGHLTGGGGGDTFVFNQGYGALTIDESDIVGGAPNRLQLGVGISISDVAVTANADGDLILTMPAGDKVVIRGALNNVDGSGTVVGVKQVRFHDGTTWSYSDLLNRLTPTDDHVLYGDSNRQEFNLDSSAATIVGRGGGDLIHYVAGHGILTINEVDAGVAPNNSLVLDASIAVSAVTVVNDGNGNAVLSLGGADQVMILGQFTEPGASGIAGVQAVIFGDGTTWTARDIQRLASGTTHYVAGGDAIEIDEALLPAAGRPTITIDPSLSLANLNISLEPGGDTLTLSSAGQPAVVFNNILVNGALANQHVSFDDGTVVSLGDLIAGIPNFADIGSLRGSAHAETFDTKGKLPHVTGGGGGDTFVYARGYGLLEIAEDSVPGSLDNVLQFGSGIDPADVTVTGNESGDLILSLGDDDQVTLSAALRSNATVSHGVQHVTFADGTIWGYQDLLSRARQALDGSTGLYGDARAQVFDTQGVSHLVVGGGGGDTIAYGTGYGHLRISEIDPNSTAVNILAFATGIAPGSVTVSGDASGNVTLSLGGQDQITIDRQAAAGGSGQGLQEIHFTDGTIWNRATLLALAYPGGNFPGSEPPPQVIGDANDNVLTGSAQADVLIGNGGDDTLSGLGGDDEYRYASGDGNDTIIENGLTTDNDVLRLTDLNPADVSLSHVDDRLIVRDNTTGQQITIYSQFNPDPAVGIEHIVFADGTSWDRARIAKEAWIKGNSFNNYLAGTDGDDTIVGGLGNDTLSGGRGSDTYRYASGDGNDDIGDYGNPADVDVLKLTDLNPSNVALSRDRFDLLVTDQTTGQVIRVDSQFLSGGNGIEQLTFADGTIWDRQAIAKNAWIVGDAGANYLWGFDDGETYRGGQGNDYIAGGGGSDEYRYASGDGNDQIDDSGSVADVDKLVLTDIASTGVQLRRDGVNLYVRDNATGQEIEILNQFYSDARYGIEQISFSDGTSWNRSDIVAAAWIRGDGGDNRLSGTGSDDILVGGAGDDYLEGKGGSDEYRYASGDGNDRIHESGAVADVDTLKLVDLNPGNISLIRDGRDLKVRDDTTGQVVTVDNQFYGDERYSIERIAFADGTVWNVSDIISHLGPDTITGTAGDNILTGTSGADTLIGGTGNDTLSGGGGSDTYVFAPGDGQDVVNDTLESGVTNVIQFGSGIAPGDIYVYTANSGNDIVLGRIDSTDTVTISAMNGDPTKGIDEVHFADGTVWSHADIMARRTSFTAGNDVIIGTSGDETLYGGAGNDTLKGLAGNDVLDGGTGNDMLSGGDGDDVYRFAPGDGQDVISDYGPGSTGSGGNDRIQLGVGILPADVTVSEANNGNNLVLAFAGSTDKITISSAISTPQFRIEQVSFADGTNWSYADLLAKATTPTAGNDVLYGDETGQTLQGAAGNDKLYGRAGDDILIGGTGNDYLNGGPGNDTYIFQSGDGNDVIDDVRSAVSFNTVQLGTGITPDNTVISTSANGLDIVIGFVGSTDTITVSYMNISSGNGIDQIQFADGSSWSYADIMPRGTQSSGGSDAVTGTSSAAFVRDLGGDDQVSGLGGDDQVLGDAGNDDLTGDAGNDILGRGAAAPAFDGAPSTGGQQLLPTIASDDTPPVLGHVQHEWLWQQFDVPVAKMPISSLSTNGDASRAGMVGRSAAMLSESISAFSPSSSFLDTEGQRVERQAGEWAFSAPLATTSPRPLLGL